MKVVKLFSVASLVACLAGAPPCQVLHEPGYTLVPGAQVAPGIAASHGTVVEDREGNLYATADTKSVYKKNVGSDTFQVFATLPLGGADEVSALALVGNKLCIGAWLGKVYTVDLALGTPAVLLGTVAPDQIVGLAGRDSTEELYIGTKVGIYKTSVVAFAASKIVPSGCYPGLWVNQSTGELTITQWGSDTIQRFTPPAAPSTFFSPTNVEPDAVAVHPVTGDVFVLTSWAAPSEELNRIDALGTGANLFMDGVNWDQGPEPTAMAFTRDASRLLVANWAMPAGVYRIDGVDGFPAIVEGLIVSPSAATTLSGLVDIQVQADEVTGGDVTMDVSYSTDSGNSYNLATLQQGSAISNPTVPMSTPTLGRFIWNSLANSIGVLAPQAVILKLSVHNGAVDSHRTINVTVDNRVAILVQTPLGGATLNADVSITFDAVDAESDPVDVRFDYSTDGGASFTLCTPSAASVLANPIPGMPTPSLSSPFVWNSLADTLGLIAVQSGVILRAEITDGTHRSEGRVIFDIDSRTATTWTSPQGGSMLRGDADMLFDTHDSDFDALPATFDFSVDGGATWARCARAASSPLTNPSAPIATPAFAASWVWNSYADHVGLVGAQPVDVRVTVTDGVRVSRSILPMTVDNSLTGSCEGTCGDCSQDGTGPNIIDSLCAAKVAVALMAPPATGGICCDVNMSGTIDVIDSLRMAQAGVGLMVVFTCP